MRLSHSVTRTGLIIGGLLLLGFLAPSEATAASDCPCVNTSAGVCVPDPACEARQRELRDRLMREHWTPAAPGSDTTARPPTTIAPAPHTTMEYHVPAPATLAPPPRVGTTAPPPLAPRPPNTTSAVLPAGPNSLPGSAPPASTPTAAAHHRESASGRPPILDTGYSRLSDLGKEVPGYGLYSYAILPSDTKPGEIFLTECFTDIPTIGSFVSQ